MTSKGSVKSTKRSSAATTTSYRTAGSLPTPALTPVTGTTVSSVKPATTNVTKSRLISSHPVVSSSVPEDPVMTEISEESEPITSTSATMDVRGMKKTSSMAAADSDSFVIHHKPSNGRHMNMNVSSNEDVVVTPSAAIEVTSTESIKEEEEKNAPTEQEGNDDIALVSATVPVKKSTIHHDKRPITTTTKIKSATTATTSKKKKSSDVETNDKEEANEHHPTTKMKQTTTKKQKSSDEVVETEDRDEKEEAEGGEEAESAEEETDAPEPMTKKMIPKKSSTAKSPVKTMVVTKTTSTPSKTTSASVPDVGKSLLKKKEKVTAHAPSSTLSSIKKNTHIKKEQHVDDNEEEEEESEIEKEQKYSSPSSAALQKSTSPYSGNMLNEIKGKALGFEKTLNWNIPTVELVNDGSFNKFLVKAPVYVQLLIQCAYPWKLMVQWMDKHNTLQKEDLVSCEDPMSLSEEDQEIFGNLKNKYCQSALLAVFPTQTILFEPSESGGPIRNIKNRMALLSMSLVDFQFISYFKTESNNMTITTVKTESSNTAGVVAPDTGNKDFLPPRTRITRERPVMPSPVVASATGAPPAGITSPPTTNAAAVTTPVATQPPAEFNRPSTAMSRRPTAPIPQPFAHENPPPNNITPYPSGFTTAAQPNAAVPHPSLSAPPPMVPAAHHHPRQPYYPPPPPNQQPSSVQMPMPPMGANMPLQNQPRYNQSPHPANAGAYRASAPPSTVAGAPPPAISQPPSKANVPSAPVRNNGPPPPQRPILRESAASSSHRRRRPARSDDEDE